jgi:hypothetical protein
LAGAERTMKTNVHIIKVTLCGPSDVSKELEIAKEVVDDWNHKHSDALHVHLKHQHWATDSTPDMRGRSQGIINRQMIDDTDIIVAVFWSRFGTPTGIANAGTEEEIRRGISLGKRVMVYFSDLEPLPKHTDIRQLTQVNEFREELKAKGLYWNFARRQDFRSSFDIHLAKAVHEMIPDSTNSHNGGTGANISGSVVGSNNNNVHIGDSVNNYYQKPPAIKNVVERRPGSVTTSEETQIQKWIESLVEGTVGKTRQEAFGEWWSRFRNRYNVRKVENLSSGEMADVEQWYKEQKGIQTRGLKNKAPDAWRTERIKAIKAAMRTMGQTNETYYPQVATRLKMKKPFRSLKDLTKQDLDRVYAMARRDSHKN